ncbi:glycan metabolism protein RagB [Bacteroidia bacterium]|nr:glycan metabolism protein RagB [Bacteroidia bacterium]
MKTKYLLYKALLAVALLPAFTACEPSMDFINPTAAVEDSYYMTKEHLIYAANGCYNIPQILQFWGRNMPYALNLVSDEAIYTPQAAAGDPDNVDWSGYTTNSSHGMTREIFQNLYVLQYTSNLAIQKLTADGAAELFGGADDATYKRSLGEAYFFRAFSRFLATFMFGDEIPDRDYPATGGQSDSYESAREPGYIYQRMVEDLTKAADLLPGRAELYTGHPENMGRIGKGAAQALLAKVYMGRPILDSSAGSGSAEWEKAKAELKKIIDSGDYKLVDCYRDNTSIDNENNEESLYEVQFVYSADAAINLSVDFLNAGQNTWRQVGFTVSPGAGGWYNVMPSMWLYNEFERDAAGNIIDPRAFQGLWIPGGAKFFARGVQRSYEDTYNYLADSWLGKFFGTRKYCIDDNSTMPDMMRGAANDRILRYADVLLMYAECCIETGDENTALQYIDKVRSRANNQVLQNSPSDAGLFYTQAPGTLPTAQQLLNVKPVLGKVTDDANNVILPGVEINTARRLLKHEYTCELFLEGWRFFNLMRWYNNPADPDHTTVINGLVNKYKIQEHQTLLTGPVAFRYEKNHILPIPATELSVNPNMKPNSAN